MCEAVKPSLRWERPVWGFVARCAGAEGVVVGLEDVPLTDQLALAEIELYGEVVIAASASDHPLSVPELDRVLGLQRESRSCEVTKQDSYPREKSRSASATMANAAPKALRRR
jgi:hypothetical protein